MSASKEVLMILVVISIQDSLQQLTTPSSAKYQRVTVVANSFNDIRTTNLGGAG